MACMRIKIKFFHNLLSVARTLVITFGATIICVWVNTLSSCGMTSKIGWTSFINLKTKKRFHDILAVGTRPC